MATWTCVPAGFAYLDDRIRVTIEAADGRPGGTAYVANLLLSVMESGRDETGFSREAISLHSRPQPVTAHGLQVPAELHLPPNLHIVGTVNKK